MKTLNAILPAILALGCASSGSTNATDPSPQERPEDAVVDENGALLTLADYLRQVPGIVVSGSGSGTRVELRGASSFYLDTRPLYVVDEQVAGNDYFHVANLVPVRQIDHVRVLKGSDATVYGVRGGNGVILIVTKK